MEHIIARLVRLGLTEKQARIYLALVELGQGTAYRIAKRSRVKRPTVYVLLDELRLKGLVLKVPHAKKQVFIAKGPEELFAAEEEKLADAKRVLPDLLSRAALSTEHRVNTYFFEGKDGMRQALEYGRDAIAGKELLAYYAKSSKGAASIPKHYMENNKRLAAQGTKIRSIRPKHESLMEFRAFEKAMGWPSLALPESELASNVTVEIADAFVRILLHKEEQALIVENGDFAHMMRQIFEIVWVAKKKSR